jgi:hypothetical protein
MEISAETIKVLSNFSQINGNIVIKPGNKITTMSEARNVLAEAVVPEQFDTQVGIYDLSEFLRVINLVDTPNVMFKEKFMNIGGNAGRAMVTYYYSDPEMLTTPQKSIVLPSEDVWFDLPQQTLSALKQSASAFGHNHMIIEPDGDVIKISVVDLENPTSNSYSILVDGNYKENFKFIINISNLKMINGDYQVKISKQLISEFTSKDGNLKYWVALEKSSKYGE